MNFIDLHTDFPNRIIDLKNPCTAASYLCPKQKDCRAVRAIYLADDLPNAKTFYQTVLAHYQNYKATHSGENGNPLMVENIAPIVKSSQDIMPLAADGVQIISLTWNNNTPLAGGAKDDGRLTPLGKKVIAAATRQKMLIDCAHLNRQSTLDVLENLPYLLVTHANVAAVKKHPRNLSDEVLKRAETRPALIGLSFYPEFLGPNPAESFYRNIEHLLNLGLADKIALGSDFDGAETAPFMKSYADLTALADFLMQKGLSFGLISKIFYANAIEFFRQICKNNSVEK